MDRGASGAIVHGVTENRCVPHLKSPLSFMTDKVQHSANTRRKTHTHTKFSFSSHVYCVYVCVWGGVVTFSRDVL